MIAFDAARPCTCADADTDEHCIGVPGCGDDVAVKMIDFGQALIGPVSDGPDADHDPQGPDSGYLLGLQSLLLIMQRMLGE